MIKASNRFKAKLRRTLQATGGVRDLPELSPLQRHYYEDVWELLYDLEAVIYLDSKSVEFTLQTKEEICEAKEKGLKTAVVYKRKK